MNTQDNMQLLLTGIILLAVFAGILQAVLKRTRNRRAVPAVIVILTVMFLGFAAVLFFLVRDMDDSGLVLYSTIVLLAVAMFFGSVYFTFVNFRQINKKALTLFLTYLLAVLFITLLSRDGESNSTDIQMEVFRSLQKALRTHSFETARHMLLNVALFVPLGFFFPMLHERLRSWLLAMTCGIMLSTAIESVQLAAGLGICDIDDILANTFGMIAGYLLYDIIKKVMWVGAARDGK